MTGRLDIPLQVTLDVAGGGSASATVPWGQRWEVSTISTSSTAAATGGPTFIVYRGGVSPANIIAATYSGAQDVAGGSGELFFAGEVLTVVWAAGVAGAKATAHIVGASVAT